jgi:hypothetical protein
MIRLRLQTRRLTRRSVMRLAEWQPRRWRSTTTTTVTVGAGAAEIREDSLRHRHVGRPLSAPRPLQSRSQTRLIPQNWAWCPQRYSSELEIPYGKQALTLGISEIRNVPFYSEEQRPASACAVCVSGKEEHAPAAPCQTGIFWDCPTAAEAVAPAG